MWRLKAPSIEVIVGRDKDRSTWSIPQALLNHNSELLRLPRRGVLEHDTKGRFHLQNYDPKLFQHFVRWIYFATLPRVFGVDKGIYIGFKLWVLSERLKAYKFQEEIMRRIYQAHSFGSEKEPSQFYPAEVKWCWTNAGPKSHLRSFILETLPQHWVFRTEIKENMDDWEGVMVHCPDLGRYLSLATAGLCADRTGKPQSKPVEAYLKILE
jgi:hypothetical protein